MLRRTDSHREQRNDSRVARSKNRNRVDNMRRGWWPGGYSVTGWRTRSIAALALHHPAGEQEENPRPHVAVPLVVRVARVRAHLAQVEADDPPATVDQGGDQVAGLIEFEPPRHRGAGMGAQVRAQTVDIEGHM